MNENVKTVGYLLKNYTDSQCYDQYVKLDWLIKRIEELRFVPKSQYGTGYETAIQDVIALLVEG